MKKAKEILKMVGLLIAVGLVALYSAFPAKALAANSTEKQVVLYLVYNEVDMSLRDEGVFEVFIEKS